MQKYTRSSQAIWVLLPFQSNARWCLNMIISLHNRIQIITGLAFHFTMSNYVLFAVCNFFFILFFRCPLPPFSYSVSALCSTVVYVPNRFDLHTNRVLCQTMLENLLLVEKFRIIFFSFFCSLFFFIVWRRETGIICCSWRRSYWYWMIWNYHKTHAAMTDVSIQHSLCSSSFHSSILACLYFISFFAATLTFFKSKLDFPSVLWSFVPANLWVCGRNLNMALNVCRRDVFNVMWFKWCKRMIYSFMRTEEGKKTMIKKRSRQNPLRSFWLPTFSKRIY